MALRIPPDHWLVVDSFKCASKPAAQFLTQRYGGTVHTIVLTHPHADHYNGILELLQDNPTASIGCVHPNESSGPAAAFDPKSALKQRAKPTYDFIWNQCSGRRWSSFRHTERAIGEATLTSLHPPNPVAPADWQGDENTLSSAMTVHWQQVTLLLGADVPNTSWETIAEEVQNLQDHSLLKVPHHGSQASLHQTFLQGADTRCWIVTPFKAKQLPKPEGLGQCLEAVQEIHVTALPYRHNQEAVHARAQLANLPPRKGLARESILQTVEALNRHVVASFDPAGNAEFHFGPGSVTVERQRTPQR